jgi:radical SAM protein with 4Fe4S-binding SPASM domain
MRSHERNNSLLKSPLLAWNILVRGYYPFIYDQMDITMKRMNWPKRHNLFMSGANLLHRRIRPWSMPLHMQFELTNYCNLKCPVCPTGIKAINRKKQAMDVDLFKRLIDQVGPYLLTTSLWAWGEPLLHPQIEDILKTIRKHKIATFLSTNGQTLNDEKVLNALINEPPTYLIVAIDGLTDETNSQFRTGARLEPALAGIRKLAEMKQQRGVQLPVLHMRFIVMKHNQHQVAELQDFARDHHFDLLTLRTLSIIDNDAPDATHQDFIPDDNELRAYQYKNSKRIKRSDYYCLEPFWFPTVFADGTVVACEQDYNAQMPLGTFSDSTPFRSIWNSKQANNQRKHIRDHNCDISFCQNCPYRDRETTDVSIQAHCLNSKIDYHNLLP